jgi:hypothetical protein
MVHSLQYFYMGAALVTTAFSRIINMSCNQGSEKSDLDNALADVKAIAKGKYSDTVIIIC